MGRIPAEPELVGEPEVPGPGHFFPPVAPLILSFLCAMKIIITIKAVTMKIAHIC